MVKKWSAIENKSSGNVSAFSMKKMKIWVNSNVKNEIKHSLSLKTA